MPAHYKRLKKLPWAEIPATPAVSTDHGHRARRTIKAALASAWIEFAGAAQVAQLRRAVTKKGKKTVENKLHWATSPARKTNHWSGPETRPA